jgi:hypothetical protein
MEKSQGATLGTVLLAARLLKATMRFEEGCGHLRRWHSTPTRQFTSRLPRLGIRAALVTYEHISGST